MSAGVSEQRMKGQGNQALNTSSKHVETEERSIPWSQQVDEAAYEHLSTPTDGNQPGYYESSSGGGGGFQYPPFNVRDESSSSWSGGARDHGRPSRRTSNDNYDNDGMHGKSFGHQSSHNYFPGNGDYNNSWSSQQHMNSSQHSRKGNYDNSYRSDRSNYHNDNGKVRSIQRGMQNMLLDGNENRGGGGSGSGVSGGGNSGDGPNSSTHNTKSKSSSQTSAVPKQMTWASIASQPAKPTLRTSSTSSTFKKKGPGMPPPPMVPGKHNMDIGTWDTPKNGPALVPPPPPPVVPVPIMEPSPLSQSKSNSGQSNSASLGDRGGSGPGGSNVVVSNVGGHGDRSGGHHSSGPANNQSNQKGSPPLQSSNPQNSLNANQNNSGGPSGNVNHIRPSWMANQNNRSHNNPSQNQRPNVNQGWRSERNPSSNSYHGQSQYNKHSGSPPAQAVNHPPAAVSPPLSNSSAPIPIVERMPNRHDYNPSEIDMEKAAVARFFVIKSFSEDDVHRSIKYEIWCSTERGNKRLDRAYRERQEAGGVVYLFFSVNGSGHFCGMAEMISPVDYNSVSNVWSQNKWKGMFKVKWIYAKDAPNSFFRHIILENNDNKSVCNSRDTQEILNDKGIEVLNILHSYQHTSWIFDDFEHYDVIQKKSVEPASGPPIGGNGGNPGPRSFEGGSSRYRSGERGGGEQDNDRNYDKYHNSGGFRERDRDRENKNYGRGGYNNYDNRRHDDHRGSYERGGAREGSDGPNNYGQNRDNRENSGGDFHNSRSFHRGEFNRRDDRDRGHSGYNNRDRDNYGDNSNGEFMNRGDGPRGGGFRDHYNRDRGDHYLRGRGRGGNGGFGGGGHRN